MKELLVAGLSASLRLIGNSQVPGLRPIQATRSSRPGQELPRLRPQEGDAARAGWGVRVFRLAARVVFRTLFRVRVVGLKNVPRTPVIVCANHLGWADPFLVLLFFPVEPRIYALGLDPSRVSRLRTMVVDALQVMVALDPARPLQALRISEGVLKRGGSLLIFPEGGTLGAQEGTLLELQHGAAHLSVTTGVPLLPVGITGTKELWLRRTLTMRIGKPIDPARFEGDTRTRMHAMTARLEKELWALLPGDRERARFKPMRKWLTKVFY
jgi:1-acyl-sn-glycerol-3-phosphate acyltransferase